MDRADSIVIGPALVGYRREPEVELQLDRLRSAPRGILQRLASDRELRLETLVSVARSFLRAGGEQEANRILEELARRVTGRIHRLLQVWDVRSAEDRDDLILEILHMLFSCVRSLGPEQEFWECRFWVCFDRRAQSILRSWAGPDRSVASLDALADSEPGLLEAPSRISPLDRAAARQALAELPEPLRTTFYLKHLAGYQEESRDESELTIARVLGVTGRTVRNYLERANTLLAEWRSAEVP